MKMDSLIYLDIWCPSLPIILKLFWLMGGWFGYCGDEWVRGPSGALCILHQRSWRFSLCIHHHRWGPHIDTSRWHHFGRPWGLCPWESKEVFDGPATFEVSLDPIPSTDLFDTFTKALCVGYDYMTLLLTSLVAAGVLLAPWLLTPSMASLEGLVSLFSTLSKAHLGYLHLVRAFLRCSFSCLSSSGLLHTVWALWERVLMTLNLVERLWWLSHCKYWFVTNRPK